MTATRLEGNATVPEVRYMPAIIHFSEMPFYLQSAQSPNALQTSAGTMACPDGKWPRS